MTTSAGTTQTYDYAILACHSDTALSILRRGGRGAGGITPDEDRILSRFRWNSNEVILHSDIDVSPTGYTFHDSLFRSQSVNAQIKARVVLLELPNLICNERRQAR